jgi:hypothetical protein
MILQQTRRAVYARFCGVIVACDCGLLVQGLRDGAKTRGLWLLAIFYALRVGQELNSPAYLR